METSDHVPCLVSIGTNIPKSATFRFENYLMEHENFLSVVQHGWSIFVYHSDMAKRLTAKFKNLRRVIKAWQSHLSSLKDNISNVKIILELLCMIEEFKDLTLIEWNFKSLLEDKLLFLLKQQRIYWKQRCTIRWVKEGDAGTKFSHANATIKYRKNLITFLEDPEGSIHSAHHMKANILWEAYKDRLGKSKYNSMLIDLHTLLHPNVDLSCLDEPFTTFEIDAVIQNLPNDKSPGPDGFNTDFVKRCWPIIKQDIYDLCHAFYNGEICLQSTNGSYITLIPMFENAMRASEFRAISLLNTSMKIITKLLANRLQKVIHSIIHKNHYGFIQTRTIQDCLA
ncbi:hypothetical protein PVAP13_6NG185803 [Panicum virgatum]|uniref:Reverse transcriptase domain-containing protein n=1 Tax=Panicum virgatum TaxID=38727 RepID=A0A8T0QYP9_PANVG|nr:hypothetical protein PVAP13_6NG185803 [Panicum virgatum]